MYYIKIMDNTKFQITDDGSVGLYDYKTNDIYHSITGAYKEAYDKFIKSSGFELYAAQNNCVSILDICYGIGYNSKTAADCALKINNNIHIKIDALENNSYAASISPLIKDNINNLVLKEELIKCLSSQIPDFYKNIEDIWSNPNEFRNLYIDASVCPLIDFILSNHTKYHHDELYDLLHNIYYQNISNSMENCIKRNNSPNINFKIILGDARQTIDECNSLYDFVFLDAFTPSKQPVLWTYQFLSKVKSKMKQNSVLATYSNSAPVRKSLIDLGFNITKTVIDNKPFGTIATLTENKHGTPLDKYELGLLETKSGILYYDNETLTLSSAEILFNRNVQMKNSNLMSSTKYIKKVKNEIKV